MTFVDAGTLTQRLTRVGRRIGAKRGLIAVLGPLLVVALSALRSPGILRQGHLWSEDAFFLTHALASDDVLSAVLYVYNGHLEILNSAVFALAAHLKLKTIPLVTTYCGLLIESGLAYSLVFFRRDLDIGLIPALMIGVLIVVSPCAPEHQLNMLNSVWLTSALLVVLINLPPERLEGHGAAVAIATAVLGLSGIPATCLMPVALLYAAAWRSRPHLIIAATLALCLLVQGTLVLSFGAPHRFGSVSPWVYLAAPFFHVVVEHLLGIRAASVLDTWFQQSMSDTAAILSLMLAPLALLGWMLRHIVRSGDSRSRLLLVTFLYVVTFNIAFAIGDRNDLFSIYDMRYFFVPSFTLGLLMARAGGAARGRRSPVVLGLLTFVTVLSTRDFFADGYNAMYVTNLRDWRRDVDTCRAAGVACRIEVDPGGYYVVDVPERALR